MADENDQKDGGTPEPKTYSEDEMAAAVAAAKKEGASESYGHFQSIADKRIAEAENRNVELTKTISDMKEEHLKTLSPEDRRDAMIEELYKERHGVQPSSQPPDKSTVNDAPPAASGNTEDEMRKTIGTALESMGLDPSKVSWGDGKDSQADLKIFLGSVVDQVKAGQSDDKGSEGDKNQEKPGGENNVDTSRGAGGVTDFNTVKPQDLIASEPWKPIRGMIEE